MNFILSFWPPFNLVSPLYEGWSWDPSSILGRTAAALAFKWKLSFLSSKEPERAHMPANPQPLNILHPAGQPSLDAGPSRPLCSPWAHVGHLVRTPICGSTLLLRAQPPQLSGPRDNTPTHKWSINILYMAMLRPINNTLQRECIKQCGYGMGMFCSCRHSELVIYHCSLVPHLQIPMQNSAHELQSKQPWVALRKVHMIIAFFIIVLSMFCFLKEG